MLGRAIIESIYLASYDDYAVSIAFQFPSVLGRLTYTEPFLMSNDLQPLCAGLNTNNVTMLYSHLTLFSPHSSSPRPSRSTEFDHSIRPKESERHI